MTRQEEEMKQLKDLVNRTYGGLCTVVGVLAQMEALARVDLSKAATDGMAMMPREIAPIHHGAMQVANGLKAAQERIKSTETA